MQALDEDEKGYTQIDTAGGRQKLSIICVLLMPL